MSDRESHREMICIGCPLGCHLVVEQSEGGAWRIDGYSCKKGKTYALQEVSDPRRMVATTVAIEGALWRRLPVRTATPIPKDLMLPLCQHVHTLRLRAPVKMGDVVLRDALGTGIDVIATRSLAAR